MRIQFKKLQLNSGDKLKIYNKQGDLLTTYDGNYMRDMKEYFWTEWQTTDALNLELTTGGGSNAYGFIVDLIEYRVEPAPPTSYFAESYHPYANNYQYTWTVSHSGANQMRIQFKKIELNSGDKLRIYDKEKNLLTTYDGNYMGAKEYFWTEWETTDALNLELQTSNDGNDYGFIVDLIETEDGVISPPSPTIGLSFTPLTGTVTAGHTVQYAVVIDAAPAGLSEYNVTVSLTEPSIGEITAVTYPAWATTQESNSLPADSVSMQAGDTMNTVGTGAANVTLCTLTVRGDTAGETNLTITSIQIDDDSGGQYTAETTDATLIVESLSAPEANFTANVTVGNAPLTVRFTDTSVGTPASWDWTFSDHATSSDQNPVHVFTTPGTYTVSLSVNEGECTCTKSDYITVFTPLLLGDANSDGAVNQADTLRVLKEVVGMVVLPAKDTDAFEQTDVHRNGAIEIGDAMYIAQHNVGLRDKWFMLIG